MIKLRWGHVQLGCALNPMIGILVRREQSEDRDTLTGEKAMWRWRQKLERWSYKFRIARRHQKLGRGKEGVSPSAFRASGALLTLWFQSSSLQNCGMMSFCCFKSHSVCTLLREFEDTNPVTYVVHFTSMGNYPGHCNVSTYIHPLMFEWRKSTFVYSQVYPLHCWNRKSIPFLSLEMTHQPCSLSIFCFAASFRKHLPRLQALFNLQCSKSQPQLHSRGSGVCVPGSPISEKWPWELFLLYQVVNSACMIYCNCQGLLYLHNLMETITYFKEYGYIFRWHQ